MEGMGLTAEAVRTYMLTILDSCRDPYTGELVATWLAERAYDDLEDNPGFDEIPEVYWEVAGDLAVEEEERSATPG